MRTEYNKTTEILDIIFFEYDPKRRKVPCPHCHHIRVRDLPDIELWWMGGWCRECKRTFIYDHHGVSYKAHIELPKKR